MSQMIVIGGGAAGMMAAISGAKAGHQVRLLEKNEKLGKKIYITGKGRCNLTNACPMEDMMASVVTNSKFLYSSFYGFYQSGCDGSGGECRLSAEGGAWRKSISRF